MKSRITTVVVFAKKPFQWFLSTRRRNKVILIIIVLGIVIFSINTVKGNNPRDKYKIETVERGEIIAVVSETGNVNSAAKVDVYSTATGIIDGVYVQNGDIVTRGTELFSVKSTATDQERATALAALLQARAILDSAKATEWTLRSAMYAQWESFRDLATNDTYENSDESPNSTNREAAEFQISQDKWKAAEASYKNQQQVVSQAAAAVHAANLAYQSTIDTVVKATSEGIVSNLGVSTGESVTAKNATAGTIALSLLGEQSSYQVMLELNEVDIPKIDLGEPALIKLDALPDQTFEGKVIRVDSVGTDTQGVITYKTVVEIVNPSDEIRYGMTADVDITVAEARDVLTVPNSALKPYQGKRAVYALDPKSSEPVPVPVEVGIRSLQRTEIKSGLTEGAEIIVGAKNGTVEKTGNPGPFGG